MSGTPHNTSGITGLHHVTIIAGDAQENLDFYSGTLGMRLVKKSVNQDDPGTYHLFYADADGHPGSDITFFPWPQMPSGRPGAGLTNEVTLAIPPGSLEYWARRLAQRGVVTGVEAVRFGDRTLTLTDPHGLALALSETAGTREFTPWGESSVPAGWQIRGLHGVRMAQSDLAPSARFLTKAMGFTPAAEEQGWHRFVLGDGGSGRFVDVEERPGTRRGAWGVGSVHHVAWRVPHDDAELAARQRIIAAGGRPTEVIDRFWFRSVYFKEPGGALFEIATDGPGFAVDEAPERLGEQLVLPPWLEPHRDEIERGLPMLVAPRTVAMPAMSAAKILTGA